MVVFGVSLAYERLEVSFDVGLSLPDNFMCKVDVYLSVLLVLPNISVVLHDFPSDDEPS